MTRDELLEAHAELTQTIRASETWDSTYAKAPEHLRRLIEQEALLQASVTAYLSDLRQRALTYVNWSELQLNPVQASDVPNRSDEQWTAEEALLAAAAAAYILNMHVIGAQAGEVIYNMPVGITDLDEAILKAAGTRTAAMVKDVTTTTRNLIRRAVQQSVMQGEDTYALTQRIQRLVASPVRAEMIAQTESVNAYQAGLDIFGEQSNVKSWTWSCDGPNPCQLCAPLHGVTKKIGEMFVLANGAEVSRPAAHVRCACGRVANY